MSPATVTQVTIDYQARSGVGVVIQTFGSAEIAAAWVEAEAGNWPGYRIERVRRTERRDVIFQDESLERAA